MKSLRDKSKATVIKKTEKRRDISKCFWLSACVWGCVCGCDQLWSLNQQCDSLLLRGGQCHSRKCVCQRAKGEEMWGYVRGCVHTPEMKSGSGPCWCGTKCHNSIKVNSPIQVLGLGTVTLMHAGRARVWWLTAFVLSFFLSLSHSQHTQALPLSDLPERAFGRCVKSEQHI